MLDEPRCYTRSCKHFIGVTGQEGEATSEEEVVCSAYPKGIPFRIAYGDDPHDKVAKDQVGTDVYERVITLKD